MLVLILHTELKHEAQGTRSWEPSDRPDGWSGPIPLHRQPRLGSTHYRSFESAFGNEASRRTRWEECLLRRAHRLSVQF